MDRRMPLGRESRESRRWELGGLGGVILGSLGMEGVLCCPLPRLPAWPSSCTLVEFMWTVLLESWIVLVELHLGNMEWLQGAVYTRSVGGATSSALGICLPERLKEVRGAWQVEMASICPS